MIRFLFFNSLQDINWKHHPKLRKYYVHRLVKNNNWKGKEKSEVESFFGADESGKFLACRWSYYIETRKKMKYYLVFDFREDRVVRVRYKVKMIL